jgi:tRNA-2-methylthio-N6-dimethylallyladenosine synthase
MPANTTKLDQLGESVFTSDLEAVRLWNETFSRECGGKRRAYTHSFGCSQNVADGEKINGLLLSMGYEMTDTMEEADLILYNTCAVRESAEDRVFGHVGSLKSLKRKNPELILVLCGCMMQRPEVAEKIQKSYPYVDIVFGTGAVHRLPSFVARHIAGERRIFWDKPAKEVVEGLPAVRTDKIKASLTIMQGCDNFCSYCIVPYVRGREVSRDPDEIVKEAEELVAAGYKEIMLLGQNVNSYGKGLAEPVDFAELIRRVDAIDGEYRIRFMTSHPKDCTHALIDAIASSRHVCHHIHLPVQSGSDRILKVMNRRYTAEQYLELIDYARSVMSDVTFSSDIIVGFPGETREDFDATLALIKRVRYNALFTFIYSKRSGTPAATMPDPTPASDKSKWFRELLETQVEICSEINHSFIGETVRVLIDSAGKTDGTLVGRTAGNVIVEIEGDPALIGQFADVTITKAMNWAMAGKLV